MNALYKPDLLETGIYSLSDAARLLGLPTSTVRVWVNGRGDRQSPLIDNELGRSGHTYLISFTNLMELRFVQKFVEAGVKLRRIRAVMAQAKDLLNRPHPFATNVVFTTDGKNILARILSDDGREDVLDLKSQNYEMLEVILRSLKPDVIFDAAGEATAWFPRRDTAPNIVVHPRFSFGRPILLESHIPAEAIEQSVKVEGVDATADLYEVPVEHVQEAVRFQEQLRRAA
jgi:uncharacterized protein (DUF433 family)